MYVLYVCMYVRMHACMYVCMHAFSCIYAHTHTHTNTHTHERQHVALSAQVCRLKSQARSTQHPCEACKASSTRATHTSSLRTTNTSSLRTTHTSSLRATHTSSLRATSCSTHSTSALRGAYARPSKSPRMCALPHSRRLRLCSPTPGSA